MKAMLLAAGLGTRLRPHTHTIPKPLIPVNGIPLIFYNLALLKKYHIKKVVINLHHLGNRIEKVLGDGKEFGFQFQYSREKNILGTGGGIKRAEKLIRGFKDSSPFFLVLNADIIFDLNLANLAEFHRRKRGIGTLVVIKSRESDEYGTLYVNQKFQIVSILEEPEKRELFFNTFFAGIHLLDKKFFEYHKNKHKSCIIRDIYRPWIKQERFLNAYIYKGYWNDLGTIERLKKTSLDLKKGKIKLTYQNYLEKFKALLKNKKTFMPPKDVAF